MDADFVNLCAGFAKVTERDPLLAVSEGLVKVRLMEVALAAGWVIQEGAGGPPNAPVADYIAMVNGELSWKRAPRTIRLDSGSCDFAVISRPRFMVEIKARPDFGTKSQAQFGEMEYDVRRVCGEVGVGFLFVLDERIYAAFSGEKTEARGRPAKFGAWFNANFPSRADLLAGRVDRVACTFDATPLELRFWVQQVSTTRNRFIVAGARSDVPLLAPA